MPSAMRGKRPRGTYTGPGAAIKERERLARGWQQRHKSIPEQRKRLDQLEQKRREQPLTLDELWEQVLCLGEINNAIIAVLFARECSITAEYFCFGGCCNF